jgi:hypothetical protein
MEEFQTAKHPFLPNFIADEAADSKIQDLAPDFCSPDLRVRFSRRNAEKWGQTRFPLHFPTPFLFTWELHYSLVTCLLKKQRVAKDKTRPRVRGIAARTTVGMGLTALCQDLTWLPFIRDLTFHDLFYPA